MNASSKRNAPSTLCHLPRENAFIKSNGHRRTQNEVGCFHIYLGLELGFGGLRVWELGLGDRGGSEGYPTLKAIIVPFFKRHSKITKTKSR